MIVVQVYVCNYDWYAGLENEKEDRDMLVKKLEEKLGKSEKCVRQHRSDTEVLRQDLANRKSELLQSNKKIEDLTRRLKKVQEVFLYYFKLTSYRFLIQTSRFLIQTSRFLIQTSRFLIQTSRFLIQTSKFKSDVL